MKPDVALIIESVKKTIFILLIALTLESGYGQTKTLIPFSHNSVKLLESPFLQAQHTDMAYILAMDPDRLLAPFRTEAGLENKAEKYGNWESGGLDGHIGGHYLTALSLMYTASGNQELLDRLNYMIDVLAACQEKNGHGYVGGIPGGQAMWEEIKAGEIDAGSFSLNNHWVPLYNIHKLYAGLIDTYQIVGIEKAKTILIGLSDWMLDVTSGLSNAQMQDMLRSEHGGLNEAFAEVSAITGEEKYLDLAIRFSQRSLIEPLLESQDKLTGMHANTQIPKVIGYERIAEMTSDDAWSEAADFFWRTVVNERTVSIGGNSVREHFNPVDDFSSMMTTNQGPETCNTYNMLKLTRLLFLQKPMGEYMDYYERALYNHILSSQHPDGGLVYFTPMRPRHYRVYSQPHESFWCCVGSGIENHGKYGEMIYAHDASGIYVNLFIPSEVRWEAQGISLKQQTGFPYEEKTTLTVSVNNDTEFVIHVRRPSWVKAEGFEILVNGQKQALSNIENQYVAVKRIWKSGDVITVGLPMNTQAEYLPDHSPWVSFVHGPIVLAAITGKEDLAGLQADDSRMGHVAHDKLYPIDEAPMIIADNPDNIASAISSVDKDKLEFKINTGIYPAQYQDLHLVPFYTIHNARYMIYWPVVAKDKLEEKLSEIKAKEDAMLALEAITIDQVATGEQQPETEHNFQGVRTNSGINGEYFWRDSRGWFSYVLNDPKKKAKKLRITYFKGDKDRHFSILINDEVLAEVQLDGNADEDFYDVDYKISKAILKKAKDGKLTVKFLAGTGSVAGGIYDVRLLRE